MSNSVFNTDYTRAGVSNNDSNTNINSIVSRPNHNSNANASRNFVLFNKDMPNDMTIAILTYLREDLRTMDSVSKYFRPLIEKACVQICRNKILPPNILPKQWIFKFPDAMGIDLIQKQIGPVEESDKNVPIPVNFIEHSQKGFNLAFLPDSLTVEVDENSPLELDESTAEHNNKARLIENPDRRDLPETGKTKILKIPRTLRNTILIFQKCLKENFFFKFEGLQKTYTWQNILTQHGDADLGPSRYIYERLDSFRPGWPYDDQDNAARREGLEIAPLADAVFFDFLTYVNTGMMPPTGQSHCKRTSTLTYDMIGQPKASGIWWWNFGPIFHLHLTNPGHYGNGNPDVAVRMSARSS